MKSLNHLATLILILISFQSCSIITKSDYEEKIRDYIKTFELNLGTSDREILKQFKIVASEDVSDEGILKVIHVLQNKNEKKDSIICNAFFNQATISFQDLDIKITIPVTFTSVDPSVTINDSSTLTIFLRSIDGDFFITNIEALHFYNDYRSAVHSQENMKNRARDMASKKIYFDLGKELSVIYDSVIWYTTYQDSIYFYVTNGKWSNFFLGRDTSRSRDPQMGLVSETGRIVVPPAFDLVGTIGFEIPDVIEVKKNGHIGHYRMDGKELIPALYDFVIPYYEENVYAIVKQDSLYGWFDNTFGFHSGFLNEAMSDYIHEFGYLNKQIKVTASTTTMTEILNLDHMGFGIAMPPSHYVDLKIMDEVIPYIYTGFNALGWGWQESIEIQGSLINKISETFSALMVKLEDHFLEGREGFYSRTELMILDKYNKELVRETMVNGELIFDKIDSTILEVSVVKTENEKIRENYGIDRDDWDVPFYKYFKISDGTISPLVSNRIYRFTQFVKIDSSYLNGTFYIYDENQGQYTSSTFLPEEYLTIMRNEILAEYGYIFSDEKINTNFNQHKWYKPRFSKYEEFYDSMTEVDRHNLTFIETIIGTLNINSSS